MKLKKILYSSLLVIVFSSTSCNKWLELAPQDGITRQEFWKTKEDVRSAITGIYTSLLDLPGTIFLWGELRADMVIASPRVTAEQRDIMNVNILPSNSITKWNAFYRSINLCNTVLDYAPEAKKLDATFTDEQYNAYMGEALAVRSLMYFYLVRTFRDVPLKLKSSSKDTDFQEIGKTDEAKILDQLVADLKTAQAGLPDAYTSSQTSKGRITRLGATALLADVYLWLEQYDKCVVECEKITTYAAANPAALAINGVSSNWWQNVFGNGSSPETIFELSYTTQDNPFGSLLTNDGSNRLLGSQSLILSFFLPDPLSTTSDYRAAAFFNNSSFKITKYGSGNTSRTNFQVYRYSDVLLMKAEAMAYVGRGAESLQIIKDLRIARIAQKSTEPAILPDPANSGGISDFVLQERSREFAFEGKRWFDLLRNARKANNSGTDILTNMVSQVVPSDLQQTAINKYKDVNSWYLPIHESEIFADTKLIQNPFYIK